MENNSSVFELEVVRQYRAAMFECVIDMCALRKIYEYVQLPQFETHLGYHNTGHCVRMAMRAYELFQLECEFTDLKVLMVACLFHDFMHTGTRPDINNIEKAVAGMRHCVEVQKALHPADIDAVERLIRVTEFPFVHDPRTRGECIIRDADMMESFEPYHIKTIMYDLRHELIGVQGYVTPEEAYQKQAAFVSGMQMYTESGQRIWNATIPAMLKSMEMKAAELIERGLNV